MVKNANIKVRPWCPFCGQDIEKPQPPIQRKMDEFTCGTCQCGAVYTCDPTGFNVGACMVECLVHACDDNWDLAWELMPDDDYLTGRLDKYDEQTHQIVELGNLDGRVIRGVLYFIRLSHDISQLSKRLDTHKKNQATEQTDGRNREQAPAMEPAREPGRKRLRANKKMVEELAEASDIDGLVDLTFDDLKTLRYLQRLLYDPAEEKRWHYANVMGLVCRRLSTRKPGAVSDLLHRIYEACTDSAAAHWGLLEALGSIIAARPDIYGGFTRHLLMFRGVPSSRVQVLWALATIAEKRPDLVRSIPFYSLFPFVEHPDPLTRGQAIRLFGRIKATEVKANIEQYLEDQAELILYDDGRPVKKTVAALAQEAVSLMTTKTKEKQHVTDPSSSQ